MNVKVHFATLIEVLMTAIEVGMDSAPEICVERVRSLRRELKLVEKKEKKKERKKKVRNLLVEAIKHGMDEGFHELAVQADEFQGNHQDGAPMPGTGDVGQVPKSRSLRKLLESDGMSSLAERALGWKAAAPAPSAGGEKHKAVQPSGVAKAKAEKSKNTSGVGFSPRHGRGRRRGTAIPAAATDASTTTSTASPTQPVLPHPPLHQVSLDSSSRFSSRSSNRSSNLNSSPSSSSSRRRPRWTGFSSQALPTSAGWLAAVGEPEADVEAPTRGAAGPGDAVPDSQVSANRQSRQQGGGGGGQNERLPCSQTQRGPWDLAVHPSLGQLSPALFYDEKERLNRNCSTDSRSWFNSQMPYDISPQNATTESREVRVSDTSHLTRPAEIQNSLALAKSAADRAVPCSKGEIFSAGETRFRSSRRTVAGKF